MKLNHWFIAASLVISQIFTIGIDARDVKDEDGKERGKGDDRRQERSEGKGKDRGERKAERRVEGSGSRGGDGGGGRRGGEKERPAAPTRRENVQRSPSMSRAVPQQSARQQIRKQTEITPQRSERQQVKQPQAINRSSPERIGGKSESQRQVRQFVREHPTRLQTNRPVNPQVEHPNWRIDRKDRPSPSLNRQDGQPQRPAGRQDGQLQRPADRQDGQLQRLRDRLDGQPQRPRDKLDGQPQRPRDRQDGQPQRPRDRQDQQPTKPIQDVVRESRSKEHSRERNKYKDVGNKLRDNLKHRHPHRKRWFNNNFWDSHRYRPPYYTQIYNNWWSPTTVVSLASWLGWQGEPYYYENYDGYGYYDDYWGPSSYSTTYVSPIYIEQPIIEVVRDQTVEDEWLPLGVFALSQNSLSIEYSNMFVQLTINKAGIISGTFYNSTTDLIYEIEGFADPETQITVWKITDYPDVPVVETGIYNLTEQEVPVRLYFPSGQVTDMLLIRIQEE
ncbi:MAG: hypothetical protein H0U49_04950 [Parachlamydiaceae bacterium]|nr:hypothetical protein [Parachlamydiaceae bacterium]